MKTLIKALETLALYPKLQVYKEPKTKHKNRLLNEVIVTGRIFTTQRIIPIKRIYTYKSPNEKVITLYLEMPDPNHTGPRKKYILRELSLESVPDLLRDYQIKEGFFKEFLSYVLKSLQDQFLIQYDHNSEEINSFTLPIEYKGRLTISLTRHKDWEASYQTEQGEKSFQAITEHLDQSLFDLQLQVTKDILQNLPKPKETNDTHHCIEIKDSIPKQRKIQ